QSIEDRRVPQSSWRDRLAARGLGLAEKLDTKRRAEVAGAVPQLKENRGNRGRDEPPNLAAVTDEHIQSQGRRDQRVGRTRDHFECQRQPRVSRPSRLVARAYHAIDRRGERELRRTMLP